MKVFGRIAAIVGTVLFAVVAVLIASGVGLWERADANATPTLYPKTTLQETAAIVTPMSTVGISILTQHGTAESTSAVEIITPTSTLVVVEATATPTSAPASSTPVPVLPTETSVSAAPSTAATDDTILPPRNAIGVIRVLRNWPKPTTGGKGFDYEVLLHPGEVTKLQFYTFFGESLVWPVPDTGYSWVYTWSSNPDLQFSLVEKGNESEPNTVVVTVSPDAKPFAGIVAMSMVSSDVRKGSFIGLVGVEIRMN